jgi:hypothetical protein
MQSRAHLKAVLRSIALLSTAAAVEACQSAEAQQLSPRPDSRPDPRAVFALRACPPSMPATGARCTDIRGTARGSVGCRYGATLCQCRGTSAANAVFDCGPAARSAPNRGQLPPPELAATA